MMETTRILLNKKESTKVSVVTIPPWRVSKIKNKNFAPWWGRSNGKTMSKKKKE